MAQVFDDGKSLLDFVANKGHGIKGLVDSGIAEVPQIYIQPPHERCEKIEMSSNEKYPLTSVPIDWSKLDGPEHEKVVETIVRASETLGFFQVINHGVDLELLESLKKTAHRFFALSPEAKAAYLKGVSPSPFVKFTTSFAPESEKVLEWRDFVSMFYSNDVDAQNHWPKECKEEALEFAKSGSKMLTRLFKILIEDLGVKLEDSKLESLIGTKVVNMNFYPTCPNPELTLGAGRHSDNGTLTALLQDGIGGLQVKVEEDVKTGRKEEWIEIPPIPGALVINVGDSLQILSNGGYNSAEHRVRTTSTEPRVSIPLFFAPRPTAKVGPFPEVVERDGRALYREVVWQDYSKNFFGKPHDGKICLEYAKINNPN